MYGGGQEYRLKQEIVLGLGGARILDALGFTVRKYHMNEGHASLLTLELLNRSRRPVEDTWDERASWDTHRVMEQCVFTTHTPVEAGHDRFPWEMVERILGEVVPLFLLKELAGKEMLNMTMLAMNLSRYVNGVAKKHGEVSKALFPGFRNPRHHQRHPSLYLGIPLFRQPVQQIPARLGQRAGTAGAGRQHSR